MAERTSRPAGAEAAAGEGTSNRRWWWTCATVITCFVAAGRWYTLGNPWEYNPDESQALANALRVLRHGWSWNSVDGTSSGPLNTLVLLWPRMLGGDVTYATMRFTTIVLVAVTFVATFATLTRLVGTALALVLALPFVAFVALTPSWDFIHYNSEATPMAMIAVAISLATRYVWSERSNDGSAVLVAAIGVLVSAVPFAKLQVLPVAFCVGLLAVGMVMHRRTASWWRELLAFGAGVAAPVLFFLAPLIPSGLQDFWTSYLTWAGTYVKTPLSLAEVNALMHTDVLLTLAFRATAGCALLFLLQRIIVRRRFERLGFGGALVLIAFAAQFAVRRPGNPFPHYLWILPVCVLPLAGYLGSNLRMARRERASLVAAGAVIATILMFAPVVRAIRAERPPGPTQVGWGGHWQKSALLAAFDAKPGDSAAIWGWMASWYGLSGLPPATREAITTNQVNPGPLQGYYRSRYLKDFKRSRPAFVWDAVTPASFGLNSPETQGLTIFPGLAAIVARDYVAIGDPRFRQAGCGRLYMRRDRHGAFTARTAPIREVRSTSSYNPQYKAAHVLDSSVTEDVCTDYWLLPDQRLGSLTLELERPARVTGLSVLNTRNGRLMDRESGRLRVRAWRGRAVVGERTVDARRYPHWTEVDFERTIQADRVTVDVLSYRGLGGGLNEVLVRREP